MDTAAEILLIVVSSVLSVFLILLIIALVQLIKLQHRINLVVDRAEKVAGSMEAAASAFERTATPFAFFKLISNIVSHANRQRKEK